MTWFSGHGGSGLILDLVTVVDFSNFNDSVDICGNGPKEELEVKPQPLMGREQCIL